MAKKHESVIEDKRSRVSQADVPSLPLEQSLKIARALWENFAGKAAAPHNIALAVDLSPTSSRWRVLCGSSMAYGLTDGGYGAASISLTDLGRRAVAPTREGDEFTALREAALKPRLPADFFRRYNRAKFPRDDIAANVLVELGMPKDRSAGFVELLKRNGNYVGFIRDTKTGPFVAIDDSTSPVREASTDEPEDRLSDPPAEEFSPILPRETSTLPAANNKVFITHGKNTKIMEQISKLVALGGFEPIVSMHRETAAKPVPAKVMDDMRACSAAVIHVGSEGKVWDEEDQEQPRINPNVLIEIGAAMALYGDRFILVVETGVPLPSNLQGLYESRYTGESIELDAGMKILEALRGLQVKN